MKTKRIFSSILAVALLLCAAFPAFAADAGSASDPLISRSYATGTFSPAFLQSARDVISMRLQMVYEEYVSGLTGDGSTGSFESGRVNSGGRINLSFGESIIMSSGSASLVITSGQVVNVTTGKMVSSGIQLLANNRYMPVENSTAYVTVSSGGVFLCDGDVEITTAASFTDVPSTHWAYESIEALVAMGIITGRGNGIFDPGSNMIRGDFVTVLGRLAGINISSYTGSDFSDVSSSMYYSPYIKWASSNALVTGYSSTSFAPGDNITRAQMATLIVRYADHAGITLPTGVGDGGKFVDDSKIDSWAYEAVYAARDAGLINGKTGNVFDPAGKATRAEICALIHRLSQL